MQLEDRTVVISGAAGALGAAAADLALEQGAHVVLLARTLLAPRPHRDRLRWCEVDLLDGAAVRNCIAQLGSFDAVWNIAGAFSMGQAVHETTEADWDGMLNANVRTLLNVVRAAVPVMLTRGAGTIVNVAAMAGLAGTAGKSAYSVTKSAVIRITESMSAELRDHGVRVNCILPGTLDTPANRAAMPDANRARWVSPHDLARVLVFLSSDAARAIHGAAIPAT